MKNNNKKSIIEELLSGQVKDTDTDELKLQTEGAYKEFIKTPAQHYADLTQMKRPLLVELHKKMGLKFGYKWTKRKIIDDLLNFHKTFCGNKYLMSWDKEDTA